MEQKEEIKRLKKRVRSLEGRVCKFERRAARFQGERRPAFIMPRVDRDRCLGCGICEKSCPAGAISVDETAWIDESRCIGCGCCAAVCPAGAISNFIKEEKRGVYGLSSGAEK